MRGLSLLQYQWNIYMNTLQCRQRSYIKYVFFVPVITQKVVKSARRPSTKKLSLAWFKAIYFKTFPFKLLTIFEKKDHKMYFTWS